MSELIFDANPAYRHMIREYGDPVTRCGRRPPVREPGVAVELLDMCPECVPAERKDKSELSKSAKRAHAKAPTLSVVR